MKLRPALVWTTYLLVMLVPLVLSSCRTFYPQDEECREDGCPTHAKVSTDPTMDALASDLDKVEKHIERFGSVVPKVPDVWGQARLTEHRDDFEKEMHKELEQFKIQLNGSISRSDQAFLAQAIALSAAAQPGGAAVPLPSQEKTSTTSEAVKAPAAADTAKLLSDLDAQKVITRTEAKVEKGTVKLQQEGIGLEPAIVLEQKARYLNYLNQIRRANEGDDTADSPGYSLNLIRIPVSVLPGKHTDVGFGAEITFTLEPVLGEELLPMTFRNLVVNDLVDQIGYPLAKFLEDEHLYSDSKPVLKEENRDLLYGMDLLIDLVAITDKNQRMGRFNCLTDENKYRVGVALGKVTKCDLEEGAWEAAKKRIGEALAKLEPEPPCDPTGTRLPPLPNANQSSVRQLATKRAAVSTKWKRKFQIPSLPFSNGLGARQPFPTSETLDVYGLANSFTIALAADQAFGEQVVEIKYAHLPDVQMFLKEELGAAYRFLAQPENQHLWTKHCTPDLVRAIRSRQVEEMERLQRSYRHDTELITHSPVPDRTTALAWCILVDSALLTDRLVKDMREVASAKGVCLPCTDWADYYAPCPSREARQAFNEYVKVRWPIRVFALDPVTQDQNISDSLSTRREMQFALSLAFVSGQINANTLTRYTRRLEAEYQTVALNRTQIGFSHGENTFGWRFYPRFQTPDTDSNLTVIFRDQIIGGPNKNALLRQRRLEPGPRECVAIVLMPSFIPYLTCDSVSNWFGLANPKHKELDLTDAMRISRTIKALQVHGPKVQDADCYRSGDFPRLLRRIEQLEARLPTQTQSVQVPILNTLGGFKMFNNGVTDLGPELYGFYGSPGIDRTKPTTLFLVGDHFSVRNTKVIIGNSQPLDAKMLSRQVLMVVVPAWAVIPNTNLPGGGPYLDAHVATPYGVSREISIPLVKPYLDDAAKPAVAAKEGYSLAKNQLVVNYQLVGDPQGKFSLKGEVDGSSAIEITATDATGAVPAAVKVEFVFKRGKDLPNTIPIPPLTLKADPKEPGKYTLTKDHLKTVAEQVVALLNKGAAPFTREAAPVAEGIKSDAVKVTPVTVTCSGVDVTAEVRVAQAAALQGAAGALGVAGIALAIPQQPPPPSCQFGKTVEAANQLEVSFQGKIALP